MNRIQSSLFRSLLFGLLFVPAGWSQDPRGTMIGRVSDASGAVVPGATVRAKNLATNVAAQTLSNDVGLYQIPYLLPGSYELSAEMSGFKAWVRTNLELRTGDRLAVDIKLEVGGASETVEVSAEAPILESTTGSVSQVISAKTISDSPMRSGNLSWLFSTAPGVVLQALPYDGPWNIQQASNISSAGGGSNSFDYNVDGVTNNSYSGQTAFVPPADMVQEVRVETSSYDAQIGHTTGGSINISIKSGANRLHGTAGFSGARGAMFTRNFFTNQNIYDPKTGPITDKKIQDNTPQTQWYRYNASVGGPVYIPGLYDGRDKTFWMFGWQSHNRRRGVNTINTVPTEAMKQGDFSALLALGSSYQVYDPNTTVPATTPGQYTRKPFAGNIIPANRITASAAKLLKYYPAANMSGTADFLNNYSRTRQDTQDLYQPMVRIDHNFSQNWRMFARYSHSDFFGHFDKLIPESTIRGRRRMRPHRGMALDNVVVLSPRLVLDVRYGFTHFREYQSFDNIGYDLKEFGFSDSLISQLNPKAISFPQITDQGSSGALQLGNDGGFDQKYFQHSLLNVLNWTKTSHNIKLGFDGRLIYENVTTYGNVSPQLIFGQTYTRGPNSNSTVSPSGQGFASMLLNIPTGGGIDLNDSKAEGTHFYSLFVQDDWRFSKKLTLNLGMRWEYESPPTERFNRATRQFDFLTANPIQAQAKANYALKPIAEVPIASFQALGGVTFLGMSGNPRGIRDPYYRAFMPRFGFAYQLNSRMVMRGGYGMFYAVIGSENTEVSQPGFNQRTTIVASLDNGQSYIAGISNPLPGGLVRPKGAAGGMETFLGRSPGFFAEDGRRPYMQRWSYTLQWEPTSRNVMEIGYVGTRGVRNRVSTELNPVPEKYYSRSLERDQAVIDSMTSQVSNPFSNIAGFTGSTFFGATTLSRSQLLRPLPHFTSLATALPSGSTWYHSMMSRFERRFTKGLQFSMNYTWSKTMEATSYLNDNDRAPEHVISSLDRPHRYNMSIIYELPFGRGRLLAKSAPGWLDQIIGGWQLQAIWQGQAGPPLGFGNILYRGTLDQIKLSSGNQTLDQWFNTSAPFEKVTAKQLASNIRTFPTRITTVRGDGINVWDISAIKNFRLPEGFRLQLRCEAEGAMNHPNFDPPNTTPTSSLFGKVSSTQTNQEERRIFVGLKLIF